MTPRSLETSSVRKYDSRCLMSSLFGTGKHLKRYSRCWGTSACCQGLSPILDNDERPEQWNW